MTLQGDNPDKRAEAAEQAAIQRNVVTVPEDRLAELQRKAKLADELKEINKDLLRQIDSQEKLIAKLIESGDKEE